MWPLHPGGYQKICSGGPEKCPQDGRIALLKPLFWHAKHAQNVHAKFVPDSIDPRGVCGGEGGGRGQPRAGRAIGRHTRAALGRGLLILLCLVTRGITCAAAALLASHSALIRLPASLLCFLVVRGVPVCPSRREGAKADLLPLARYTAPALPLVVAMPASGVVTGWRRTENAAALVGAALRSVLLLPLSAFTLHRREQTRSPAAGPLRHARPGTVWRRSLERGLCT